MTYGGAFNELRGLERFFEKTVMLNFGHVNIQTFTNHTDIDILQRITSIKLVPHGLDM